MTKENKKRKLATVALAGVSVFAVAGAGCAAENPIVVASADEETWTQPWDNPTENNNIDNEETWTQPWDTPAKPEPKPQPKPEPKPEPKPQPKPEKPTTGETVKNGDVEIKLPEGTDAASVAVKANGKGFYTVTSDVLSNTYAATITVPATALKKGQVVKIKTGSTLAPVAHSVANGKITIKLHKEGELVVVTPDAKVTDIAKSQFKGDIQTLLDRGIFTGYKGKFNPNDNMTISQFGSTLSRALGLNPVTMEGMTDTKFYSADISALEVVGIMDSTPHVKDKITRAEVFAALGNLLEQNGVTTNIKLDSKFKDVKSLDVETKNSIALLVEMGAVEGNGGKLNPNDPITRGQVAKVVAKVLTHVRLI